MAKKPCTEHPNHSKRIAGINRVIGQLENIKKMIVEREYCQDIIHQIKTARGGLNSIEVSILNTHIENCVTEAIESRDEAEIKRKTKEITKYVKSLMPK